MINYRWASLILIGTLLIIAPVIAMAQATASLSGIITYRERIALPADALVTLQIAEVTASGSAGRVITEQTFATSGAQPPFRFSLPYNPAIIDAGRVYTLQGRIQSGGNILFTTDGLIPVITGNAPSTDLNITMIAARGTSLPAAGSALELVAIAIGAGILGIIVHALRRTIATRRSRVE